MRTLWEHSLSAVGELGKITPDLALLPWARPWKYVREAPRQQTLSNLFWVGLFRRNRCGFARRQYPKHEGRYLFAGFNQVGNFVFDRLHTLATSPGIVTAPLATTIPRAIKAIPIAAPARRPCGSILSAKTTSVSRSIQAKLITPVATNTANSAQQQPKQ